MTVAEFNKLKQLLSAECSRRNGYGSISSQAAVVNSVPNATVGSKVTVAQGKGTVDVFLQIESFSDLHLVSEDRQIPTAFGSKMIDRIQQLSAESMTSSTSSCRSACTGLCVGSCIGACTSCTSCDSYCAGSCSNTCVTGCSGSSC